ncbi:MAG: hypothetical protein QOH33_1265, partial [Paraburkholderia sp.]|nr:hypothetical protein [Paraburkholderia sp.]
FVVTANEARLAQFPVWLVNSLPLASSEPESSNG